ncbi:hypothetical protein C6P45_004558 [Maudiozyma exigua]|uniref:Uncharacterized protein n=1 Tax=Maudiozyma exigua TaxID=34358 RepID=A0A9P6WBN7_MAUEX|nr:hypothetical protein C6P45_004558 [Kazachstania exigua]
MSQSTIDELSILIKQDTDPKIHGLSQLGIVSIKGLIKLQQSTSSQDVSDYASAINAVSNYESTTNTLATLSWKFEPIKQYLDSNAKQLSHNDTLMLLSQAYLYHLKFIRSIKFNIVSNLITANCFIINYNLSSVPRDLHTTIHGFINSIQESLAIASSTQNYKLLNHIFLLFNDLQYVYDHTKDTRPITGMISRIPEMNSAFETMRLLQTHY